MKMVMSKVMIAVFFLLGISLTTPEAEAAENSEYIIVSGGPALRRFEKLKERTHDVFWGNFIVTGAIQAGQTKAKLKPGDKLTWLVYRPAYVRRAPEETVDILADIKSRADALGVALFWFDTQAQFVNYLNYGNDRKVYPIAELDFFGHSNKVNWMFDYSNELDGCSLVFFHTRDLGLLSKGIFRSDARTQSWGCHSGEYYSQKWAKQTGVKMWGAIGKTDYSGGAMPVPSSPGGRWVH